MEHIAINVGFGGLYWMMQSGSLRTCLLNPAFVLDPILVSQLVIPTGPGLIILPTFDKQEVIEQLRG